MVNIHAEQSTELPANTTTGIMLVTKELKASTMLSTEAD